MCPHHNSTVVVELVQSIDDVDLALYSLKPSTNGHRGHPDYNAARGLQPFRDSFWTGRTMRSLKVKSASENAPLSASSIRRRTESHS